MTKNDWYEAGDQIKSLVQEAIDSGNFSQLSTTISNVVNDTVDGLEEALKDSLGAAAGDRQKTSGQQQRPYNGESSRAGNRESSREWTRNARREAADRIRRSMEQDPQDRIRRSTERGSVRRTVQFETRRDLHPVRKKIKAPGQISGAVMKWTGYTCSGMFGLSLALLGVIGVTTGFGMAVPLGILSVLFAGSVALGIGGSRKLGLATRFKKYTNVLGERTFCLIEELASSVGESSKFVRKDLKKMIRRGFFPQGYLDQRETCLITDRSTYQQYLTTQQAYLARSEQERMRDEEPTLKGRPQESQDESTRAQVASESAERHGNLSPECRELIAQGKNYIRHIHACNDRIPDEEMSEKLDRLETVVTRIFTEAEKDPEIVDDLKKMMSYYLPTTKKLLDAYCELDEQPIKGQNIESTRKEIEAALDTLNGAFERLLDGLFEEKAWDISSDISVLNTMLAQEGLTGNDFGAKKNA